MDARRLVLIGSAVALVVAGCGSSSSSSDTTTSSSVGATTTSTTSIAPTTTATTVATKSDFEPACRPASGGATAATAAADAFDTFGPLGSTPTLTIKLPTLPPPEGSPDRLPASASVTRIAGGVLVALTADPESPTSKSSMLAAIGFDGTTRWVRCLDARIFGVWASPSKPNTALVAFHDEFTYEYHVVSTATGEYETGTDLSDLTSFGVAAESPDRLLLGQFTRGNSIPDELRLYDLATNNVESIAYPSNVLTDRSYASFGFDDEGDPTIGSPPYIPVSAVYRDGTWVTDAATIDDVLPPYVDFSNPDMPSEPSLTGHNATGSVRWTNAKVKSPGYEGSPLVADGPITIVAVCTEPVESCRSFELRGIVTATGKVAWALPGFRQLGAIGDGYALINDSTAVDPDANGTATLTPGWILVDTRTGEQVADDQHWSDSSLFVQGCCADYSAWVRRFGGVVVAQNVDVLRVWLPRAATAQEHTLSLP
jgi:hypothetical protein